MEEFPREVIPSVVVQQVIEDVDLDGDLIFVLMSSSASWPITLRNIPSSVIPMLLRMFLLPFSNVQWLVTSMIEEITPL